MTHICSHFQFSFHFAIDIIKIYHPFAIYYNQFAYKEFASQIFELSVQDHASEIERK